MKRPNPRGHGKMKFGPHGTPYKVNLENRHFGALIVVEFDGINRVGDSMWYCRCNALTKDSPWGKMACGNYKSIRGQSLTTGKSKSCGCTSITHGLTRGLIDNKKPTEYSSWCAAKDRCHNPKNHAWSDYGGRGIIMCLGWRHDYATFVKDMGPKQKGQSIERLNNSLNYSCGHCPQCIENGWPMNCKWATHKEQARNRRSTVYAEYNGIRKSLAEWAEEYGLDVRQLWERLYRYKMPIAMALSTVRVPRRFRHAPKKPVDSPTPPA